MFWHVIKSLKTAIRHKQLLIIELIVEDLDTPLHHDSFKDMLNAWVFGMQGAYLDNDELDIEVNRQIQTNDELRQENER